MFFMFILSNFYETLRELMIINNKTAKRVAGDIGVETSTITRYLRGEHAPGIDNLVLIADYFKCSADYLLGLSENYIVREYSPCPPFSERIAKIPGENGMTAYRFCRELGIQDSAYFAWKRGVRTPNVDNIVKMAETLKCSIDYILGRKPL